MKTKLNIRFLICAAAIALSACHPNARLAQNTPAALAPQPVAARGPLPGFSPMP